MFLITAEHHFSCMQDSLHCNSLLLNWQYISANICLLSITSMASVCGGCLALQDAGVPIKFPVAGIAMGLVLDTQEFGGDGTPLILSDITGSEDASGDMDFKV